MASTLAPGMLVAAPSLRCPFFNHTVVLLADHGDEGSFGFVVNKRSDVRFRQVLGELGLEVETAIPPDAEVMIGGPVSPEAGWIVFDPRDGEWPEEDVIRLAPEVAVSASLHMLEALAEGRGPSRRVMTLGYAGWGPGQLEDEMREGSWIPIDLDAALMFEVGIDDRWSRGLAALGIDPARVSGGGVASA